MSADQNRREANRVLTTDEMRTYQSMRARGYSHDEAINDALDGVDVDDVRRSHPKTPKAEPDAGDVEGQRQALEDWLIDEHWTYEPYDLSHALMSSSWLAARIEQARAEGKAEGLAKADAGRTRREPCPIHRPCPCSDNCPNSTEAHVQRALAARDAKVRRDALNEAADKWREWETFASADGHRSIRVRDIRTDAWLRDLARQEGER